MADTTALTDFSGAFNPAWAESCYANPELCVPFSELEEDCDPTVESTVEWYNMVILFGLLCLSGLFSGLNLGLMSLDVIGLEIVEKSQNASESRYARSLKPLRKYGNFLLCTLLLGNTLVNALLAIFLADISGGVIGSLITTFSIVIFGEIIPQSVCSRHGLAVGFYTRYIVMFFMICLAPVAWSISFVLDLIMGEELGSTYNRDQLEQLLIAHSEDTHGSLVKDEILIAAGALKFSTTSVSDIMTKIEDSFSLDINDRLDQKTMGKIVEAGYSRVPINENGDFITVLLIKDLILLNPEDATPIRSLLGESCCRDPFFAPPNMTLDKMLNVFQKGISHMAIVRDVKAVPLGQKQTFENIGIVTLEDLMEALIQEDIQDETDDRDERREFISNMGRYKSFHLTPGDEHAHITEKEVQAICKWLANNNPTTFGAEVLTERKLASLVRHSMPVTCMPPDDGEPDQFLWKRGDRVDYCFLVLSDGPVCVISSGQGFQSNVGPWNLLGVQSLISEHKEGFVVDFSIKLVRPVRLLKIARRGYRMARGLEDDSNQVVVHEASAVLPAKKKQPKYNNKEHRVSFLTPEQRDSSEIPLSLLTAEEKRSRQSRSKSHY